MQFVENRIFIMFEIIKNNNSNTHLMIKIKNDSIITII